MLNLLKITMSKVLYYKRKEYNITQEKMSEKCCLSLRQYIDLENGKRLPKIQTLFNIIILCNLDVNDIISDLTRSGYTPIDNIK